MINKAKKPYFQDFKWVLKPKQANKLQNKTIIKFFKKIGFNLINKNFYIFVFRKKKPLIIDKVYITNFMLVTNGDKIM